MHRRAQRHTVRKEGPRLTLKCNEVPHLLLPKADTRNILRNQCRENPETISKVSPPSLCHYK